MAYKVLHCLSFMNRGGAETFIMNVFRNIDRNKFNFDFLLQSEVGHYIDEIKQLGGCIYSIPSRSKGIYTYCKSLDTFFKKHLGEYDAIHYHTSSLSSIEILYYAKKWGVKKRIIHSHNTNQAGFIHQILHYANKPTIKYLATDYLACSEVARLWLFKYTGIFNKSYVVKNGIDTGLFQYSNEKREKIRKELSISLNSFVVGHVGRFNTVKNHTFLVKIFKEVLIKKPDSLLVLVGEGDLKDAIAYEAIELGISKQVKFLGVRRDIDYLLSAFDVFVFPSLYEGLPVSLIEAEASGIPVIASSNVSIEAQMSDNMKYISLNESNKFWAKQICSLPIIDRITEGKAVDKKGYSISNTVFLLTNKLYI